MNYAIIQERINKTKTLGYLLQIIPFVRCVILNGSLAQGKSKESSDIDILIIAKKGHIFTVRFSILLFTTILRIKRPKDENKNHAGKFCFNYFLSDDYLVIPHDRGRKIDEYCADNYSRSILVWGDQRVWNEFKSKNSQWMKEYSKEFSAIKNNFDFPINNCFLIRIGKLKEKVLTGNLGRWFEKMVKNYQIKKIKKDRFIIDHSNLIVFNDKELRFHPPKLGND